MTKSQWTAVYHYCTDNGYDTPRDILDELKANGTVDRNTKLADLGEYVEGTSFVEMYKFLGDNL